jgi:hypothetical protein
MVNEIELFESVDLCAIFVYGIRWRAKFTKKKVDTRDELLARILPAQRNVKINSDEQRATFGHEFQSAFRLVVSYSNISCEFIKFVICV